MFDQQQATVGKRQASGIRVSSARGAMVPVCVRLLASGDISLSVSGTILAKEHIPAMAPGEHVFQVFDTIAEAFKAIWPDVESDVREAHDKVLMLISFMGLKSSSTRLPRLPVAARSPGRPALQHHQ